LQHYQRKVKGHIPDTWNTLGSWFEKLPSKTRVPIEPDIALAVSIWGLLNGLVGDTARASLWFAFSVGVRLMLETMARPGEFVTMR
jgi:hypothetical protein